MWAVYEDSHLLLVFVQTRNAFTGYLIVPAKGNWQIFYAVVGPRKITGLRKKYFQYLEL